MKATWILVCDASRARVFAFEKSEQPWAVVEDITNPAGRARVRRSPMTRVPSGPLVVSSRRILCQAQFFGCPAADHAMYR